MKTAFTTQRPIAGTSKLATLRILHLEDNRLDAELVLETLRSGGFACEVTRVETREAFQAALQTRQFDLILADNSVPSFDGTSALAVARDFAPNLPFILVSGTMGDDQAIETLKSGARDYVSKHRLLRLVPAVRRALRETEEQNKALRAEEALLASERRFRYLAETSAILGSSMDYRANLTSVARLSVPRIADWCAIYLCGHDGICRALAAQHKDAAQAVRVAELLPELKGDPTAVGGNPGVLATGQSVLAEYGGESSALPEVLSSSAAADESETPNLLAEFETRLYLGVPLLVRGQSLGILLFGMSSQDRSFGPSDLAVAEDLARRAGTAIENARLFDEAQDAIHSRDEFLSIASHELKTPLTSLQLEVQVLLHLARRGAQVPAAAAVASGASFAAPPVVEAASSGQSGPTLGYVMSRLELIERQSKKLGSLINALLDVSRIAAGRFEIKLEELDLSRVVKEVIARFSQQLALSGCTLKFDARGAVIGRWDRMRLEQIVTNLISNACKYGRGKPIEIVVEDLPATARLTVRDHGIGIAPENHQRIFGRFERAASARHFGGLGLGLYIVKQILDATGGNIHVSSTPGDGSTFVVDLPKHI